MDNPAVAKATAVDPRFGLPGRAPPTRMLQLTCQSGPLGWLGQKPKPNNGAYWFHYASGDSLQPRAHPLLSAQTHFFDQASLFRFLEQRLPTGDCLKVLESTQGSDRTALDVLALVGQSSWGHLGFINPDSPFARPRYAVAEYQISRLNANELLEQFWPWSFARADESGPIFDCIPVRLGNQFASTSHLLMPLAVEPMVQQLLGVKKQVDPDNKLSALRWLRQASNHGQWLLARRPDLEPVTQARFGFERLHTMADLPLPLWQGLMLHRKRGLALVEEIIRTYCHQAGLELKLFKALLPAIQQEALAPFFCWNPYSAKPQWIGLEYIPLASNPASTASLGGT